MLCRIFTLSWYACFFYGLSEAFLWAYGADSLSGVSAGPYRVLFLFVMFFGTVLFIFFSEVCELRKSAFEKFKGEV